MVASPWSRRRVLLALVAAVVIGGAGGSAAALVRPVTYTATAQAFSSTRSSAVEDLTQQSTYSQAVIASWAALTTAPLVLDPVIDRLHLHTTAAVLAHRVHAFTPANTVVIQIDATDATPAGAARLANAVLDRLVAVAPSLQPQTGSSQSTDQLTPVQRAVPPTTPSGPSAVVLALVGALAGVLVWALILAAVQIRRRPPGAPGQPAPSML